MVNFSIDKYSPRKTTRTFDPKGVPLCAAGRAMILELVYLDRTSGLEPHMRARYQCPLLHPTVTGEACPCNDPHLRALQNYLVR